MLWGRRYVMEVVYIGIDFYAVLFDYLAAIVALIHTIIITTVHYATFP